MALISVVAVMAFVALASLSLLGASNSIQRSARVTVDDAAMDAAADAALTAALGAWRDSTFSDLPIGATREFSATLPVNAEITVTRLAESLYQLSALVDHGGESRRRVGITLRVPRLVADSLSALVTAANVVASEGLVVARGRDSAWCPGSENPVIILAPERQLSDSNGVQVPSPKSRVSMVARDSATFLTLLGTTVNRLSAHAAMVFPAGTTRHLIAAEGPGVVRAEGDLVLTGGSGAGLLIVAGRLFLAGPVTFAGVVVAAGGLETLADGAEIEGLVIAGNPDPAAQPSPDRLVHRATLRFAPCLAQAIVNQSVQPWPVRGRAWADLH